LIAGDSQVDATWVGDDKFHGIIDDAAEAEEVEGLRATYVMEGVWFGEWSTDTELSATAELTIQCVGPDCQQAETMYYEDKGVVLPCASSYGVDGRIAR
jgi:hypothetical protein